MKQIKGKSSIFRSKFLNTFIFPLVFNSTNLTAALEAITGMFTAWARFGEPDLTLARSAAVAGQWQR